MHDAHMTPQTREREATLHAVTVRAMASGVLAETAIIDACTARGKPVETAADLDLLSVRGRLPAATVKGIAAAMSEAARHGHRASAQTQAIGASLAIDWTATGRSALTMDGSGGDLVAQRDVDALDRAITRNDAQAALALLDNAECEVELVLRAPSGGARWIPSTAVLADRLSDGRWGSTLLRIKQPTDGLPVVVVAQDATTFHLECPGLILAGPEAMLNNVLRHSPAQNGSWGYRRSSTRDDVPDMFVPEDLIPTAHAAGKLEALRPLLTACARACCWYWLGRNTTITADRVTTQFNGVRALELQLLPYDAVEARDEVALFTWATAAAEPVRDDVVQQAVTFAVRDLTDIPGAAGPVLRTARSLHELASRGAVAEALAARRAARDSAVASARAAATAAREVSAKSVERALALLIAAAVALAANGQRLLSTGAATTVIIAAASLALLALLVAERIELASGSRLLEAFDQDLEQFREALGQDDLTAIKQLSAMSAARVDLSRARRAIRAIYVSVVLTVLIAGVVQLSGEDNSETPAPGSPSPSHSAPPQSTP